ncbi:MAG: hypothetical protein H0Z32_14890 [Bacillaceae bacterium]|nr:hypothetical protein [Bacillaceae bacterium]
MIDLLFSIRMLARNQLPEINMLHQESAERRDLIESIDLDELKERMENDEYIEANQALTWSMTLFARDTGK